MKVALGEALFFDPNLSHCGVLACASCHRPEYGFASPYQVPPGCDGVRGRRRAPALYNVAYQEHYFWDGRVQSLEQQALLPVVTPAEMGNVWDVVLTYLNTGRHIPTGKEYPQARAFYTEYFSEVFNGDVTPVTVSHALAEQERPIRSQRSALVCPFLPAPFRPSLLLPAPRRTSIRCCSKMKCSFNDLSYLPAMLRFLHSSPG